MSTSSRKSGQAEADEALGTLSRALRDLQGQTPLGLRELARRTHTSTSALSRYFRGQAMPSLDFVTVLAKVCESDPTELHQLWKHAAVARKRARIQRAGGSVDAPPIEAAAAAVLSSDQAAPSGEDEPVGSYDAAEGDQLRSGPMWADRRRWAPVAVAGVLLLGGAVGWNAYASRPDSTGQPMAPTTVDSTWTGYSGTVPTPAGAWNFDEGAGITASDTGAGTGAPAERHPAELRNVTWSAGRIAGRTAATFNGVNSYASTNLAIDTSSSFTVAAWVRLTDMNADRTIFTRDASGFASLYFQYHKSRDSWLVQMPSATSGSSITWWNVTSSQPPRPGVWTHLAATYDQIQRKLTLYVNGVADGSASGVTPFNDPSGAAWIGRSGSTWFAGDIADVRAWSRTIGADQIRALTSATPVVNWQFAEGQGRIVHDSTFASNQGILSGNGVWNPAGHRPGDAASLAFDGATGVVQSAGPLLRTDQSFSVAGWVLLTSNAGDATAISQDGVHSGGFQLRFGKACGCWEFAMPNRDDNSPGQASARAPRSASLNVWTHLVGVYDAATSRALLYVDGKLAATATAPTTPWQASRRLTVGRTLWNGGNSAWWPGGIDAVVAFQGVLRPDQIDLLHRS